MIVHQNPRKDRNAPKIIQNRKKISSLSQALDMSQYQAKKYISSEAQKTSFQRCKKQQMLKETAKKVQLKIERKEESMFKRQKDLFMPKRGIQRQVIMNQSTVERFEYTESSVEQQKQINQIFQSLKGPRECVTQQQVNQKRDEQNETVDLGQQIENLLENARLNKRNQEQIQQILQKLQIGDKHIHYIIGKKTNQWTDIKQLDQYKNLKNNYTLSQQLIPKQTRLGLFQFLTKIVNLEQKLQQYTKMTLDSMKISDSAKLSIRQLIQTQVFGNSDTKKRAIQYQNLGAQIRECLKQNKNAEKLKKIIQKYQKCHLWPKHPNYMHTRQQINKVIAPKLVLLQISTKIACLITNLKQKIK